MYGKMAFLVRLISFTFTLSSFLSLHVRPFQANPLTPPLSPENQVIFCTGGAGTICSAQVRALVHLGANACIVGRNVEKTENAARDIATARKGAKVLGIGGVDVRKVESIEKAVERCVKELGGVDYVM